MTGRVKSFHIATLNMESLKRELRDSIVHKLYIGIIIIVDKIIPYYYSGDYLTT